MRRYVIIGASAAGCKAAETLRRYAPDSPITVISDEALRFWYAQNSEKQ